MDLDSLRDGMNAAVPFNRHVGIELSEIAPGRCVARLPERPELLNHVATQHAAALFAVAEAASGGAFIGAMAERLGELRPLVRRAEIRYLKVARGPITATATIADMDAITAALGRDGRTDFMVDVVLTDGDGLQVAAMGVEWNVKVNAAPAPAA